MTEDQRQAMEAKRDEHGHLPFGHETVEGLFRFHEKNGIPIMDAKTHDEIEAAIAPLVALWTVKKGPQTTPEKAEFMASLPQLNSRRNARRYITRVAAGFQAGDVTAAEAKTMLYMAQLALAAAPPTPPTPSGPRKKAGFAQ